MPHKTIAVFSDLHCGNKSGLTHPDNNHRPGPRAGHEHQKQYEQRRVLWGWFNEHIKKYHFDMAIWNGDMIDGKGEKSGGTELLTSDRNEQVEWAAKIIKTVGIKRNYMTYGTPYHGGATEDFEKSVCKEAGCDKIENEGHYDVNGVIIAAKHYIGNTTSPVSRATAMSRAEIIQAMWAELKQQPKANCVIRSHIHWCYILSFPSRNFQGCATPGLEGLGSKFGIRQRDGLPIDFGFTRIEIDNLDNWGIFAEICPLELQAAHITKIR